MSDSKERQEILNRYKDLYIAKGAKPNRIEATDAGISERAVTRLFGGWNKLAEELTKSDPKLALKPNEQIVVQRFKSLAQSKNRELVLQNYEAQDFNAQLSEALSRLTLKPVSLDKKEVKDYLKKLAKPSELDRELISVWSDTHFGLMVDPEEVGGKNSFGWTEACRRAAYYTKEIASYKLHNRSKTKKLHMALLGDLIQGVIHNKGGLDNDLLVFQKIGFFHIMYHSISYLLNFFDEIHVYGIPGNHEDATHRREGDRVRSQKYDSNINEMLYALSVAFAGRVKFTIPKTPYVMIDTIGGRVIGAHGDTTFSSIGNPGSNISMTKLTHQIESFNQAEINAGNPAIQGVIVGHVHQKLEARTQNGIDVIVNPSLSGKDPFAGSLTINSSLQGQTLIESTRHYAVGDTRVVYFDKKVDQDSSLDKIIPIYGRELSFKGK